MKPIKFTSGVYRIKEIKENSSSKFYKDLKVGTMIRFEFKTGIIEKTTKIVIHNLTKTLFMFLHHIRLDQYFGGSV